MIVFIQAFLLSFLLLSGSLLQETCLFNIVWFEQPFTQQVIIFVLLKFSLLNYYLNAFCMIRIQKACTTFETGWRIWKNFQFHLYRSSTRLPDYYNWRRYTQVLTFWLRLEKIIFKLENDVISGMNTNLLWRWKSGVQLAERKAESNDNILFNKLWIFVCVFVYNNHAILVASWRYDREGDTTLFSFWDFCLFELIFLFIY